MNNKEVRELKRRLQPAKNNITHLYGCYVNSATVIDVIYSVYICCCNLCCCKCY